MKKSHSSHSNFDFRSSSLHIRHQNPTHNKFKTSNLQSPLNFQDPFSKTNSYKPSFLNFQDKNPNFMKKPEENTVNFKRIEENADNFSKKLEENPGNFKKKFLEKTVNLSLFSKEKKSENLLINTEKNAFEEDFDNFFVQSPSNTMKETINSRAYSEAMKALQMKVKKLDNENQQLHKRLEENQAEIQQIIDKKVTEKTGFFVVLEANLKKKIFFLEEEKKDLENHCFSLRNEMKNLHEKVRNLEEKSNLDYKEFLKEKNDLKKINVISKEKMRVLEEENKKLLQIKNDILKENKCISNSINNYESTFQLLQKQNENLKGEMQKNFTKKPFKEENLIKTEEKNMKKNLEEENSTKKIDEKPEEKIEMRFKLEEREKEIGFLKEKFKNFLMQNDMTILHKIEKNEGKKQVFGSFKKQKTKSKENPVYANKTLDKMIDTIISMNSPSQKFEREAKCDNFLKENSKKEEKTQENSRKEENFSENFIKETSKKIHENAFFLNSIESAKKIKEKEENLNYSITKDYSQEINTLEKDLMDLMSKYKEMSNKIVENNIQNSDLPKFRKEMEDLNSLIHEINQELCELKKTQKMTLFSKQ